jgi:hypothetical protein
MIHGAEGTVRTADFETALTEAGEGLGGGDFMDQVEIYIKEAGSACLLVNYMVVPDFLAESFHI